jgi:hypothetical protein
MKRTGNGSLKDIPGFVGSLLPTLRQLCYKDSLDEKMDESIRKPRKRISPGL